MSCKVDYFKLLETLQILTFVLKSGKIGYKLSLFVGLWFNSCIFFKEQYFSSYQLIFLEKLRDLIT